MQKISIDNQNLIDHLDRMKFSRHLFAIITKIEAANSGAVIGLEGEWGSGKTHIFNNLEKISEEFKDSVCIIKFNPWMVSGTNGIVEALLLQIAAELSNETLLQNFEKNLGKTASIVNTMINYVDILNQLKYLVPAANLITPGSGSVLALLKKVIGLFNNREKPTNSLNTAKQKVQEILKESNFRICVLIDDLDRLPPNEIATMIQAIKAVADFSNVVYVLAFDKKIAAQAIEKSLQVENGYDFLEKIIQISLPLPQIPARKLNKFAYDRLKSSIDVHKLDDQEISDLEHAWNITIALMQTPRDVERLRTRLLVAAPVLACEINIADIVLIEALSLTTPKIVEWIKNNCHEIMNLGLSYYDEDISSRGYLGDRLHSSYSGTQSQEQKNQVESDHKWIKLLENNRQPIYPIRNAMGYLFQKFTRFSSTKNRSEYKRIQEYRFFYKWLCYHDQHATWPASEVLELLKQPNKLLAEKINIQKESFFEFCNQITDLGPNNVKANSKELVEFFREAEENIGHEIWKMSDFFFGPLHSMLTIFIADTDEENRKEAIIETIKTCSIELSFMIMHEIYKSNTGKGQSKYAALNKYFTNSWNELSEIFYIKISNYWNKEDWFSSDPDFCPYVILNFMHITKIRENELRSLGSAFINNSPEKLDFFLSENLTDQAILSFGNNTNYEILPPAAETHKLLEKLNEKNKNRQILKNIFHEIITNDKKNENIN